MKKILIIFILLFLLTGCSNVEEDYYEDYTNDYEQDYYEEDYYEYPDMDYDKQATRNLTINDITVNVNTSILPNYSVSVSSQGLVTGSILLNINCNYNYQIGTLPTAYSGYATSSTYVYMNNQTYSSSSGYMPMQLNPYNISCSWSYNIMAGSTITE